jgi:flagellar basal body-associated protein FliL
VGKHRQLFLISLAALVVLVIVGAVAWVVFFRSTPQIDEIQGVLHNSKVIAIVLMERREISLASFS